jgi:hypothetical protein
MAKKKEENKESSSILDDLISKEFTQMTDLSKEDLEVKYWIDSGNYALNYVMSKHLKGGYPLHHIIGIAGKSGVGKSMFPDIASKDPIFDDVIIFDSEGSGGNGASLAKFLDCDLTKMKRMPVKCLDSYRVRKKDGKIEAVAEKDIPANLETDDYLYHRGLIMTIKKILYALEYRHTDRETLIIIDSLSNIKSTRELGGTSDMGATNKLLNDFFSSIDSTLEAAKCTIMFAGKIYTDLNNAYNVDGIIKGGEAVMYNPSLMLMNTNMADNPEFSTAQSDAEKAVRKTGLGSQLKTIRIKVKKSRFGTEGRNAWVVLDSTYGLTRYSGLLQLLIDFGLAVKEGNNYKVPGVIVNDKGEDIKIAKKDFPAIFMAKHEEYIEKLQPLFDKYEEEEKIRRKTLNINDVDDVKNNDEDEDVTSMTDMLTAMEVEQEVAASKV